MTERRARCILGLDLQNRVGISTAQKPVPKEVSTFDVLLCEQSEGWKNKMYSNYHDLFDRPGHFVNLVVNTKFKYPLCPIQEKGRQIPIHIQSKVEK